MAILGELLATELRNCANLIRCYGDEIGESVRRIMAEEAKRAMEIGRVGVDKLCSGVKEAVGRVGEGFEEFGANLQEKIGYEGAIKRRVQAILDGVASQLAVDKLTGLIGSAAFRRDKERIFELLKSTGKPFSILVIDLDHFKKINDGPGGHLAGDNVLRNMGAFIMTQTKGSDIKIRVRPDGVPEIPAEDIGQNITQIRFGGEEILLIFPNTEKEGAELAAKRLRRGIEENKIEDSDTVLKVTASIGVVTFDRERHQGFDEMFKEADEALYKAKSEGRNRCVAADGRDADGQLLTRVLDPEAQKRQDAKKSKDPLFNNEGQLALDQYWQSLGKEETYTTAVIVAKNNSDIGLNKARRIMINGAFPSIAEIVICTPESLSGVLGQRPGVAMVYAILGQEEASKLGEMPSDIPLFIEPKEGIKSVDKRLSFATYVNGEKLDHIINAMVERFKK